MNNLQQTLTKLNFFLIYTVFIVYVVIRFVMTFFAESASGDETGFLSVFQMYLEQGYYETNAFGNSTLFNLIASIVHEVISNDLFALRFTSLLFGVLAILWVWNFQKKNFSHLEKNYNKMALVTSINAILVMSFMFRGINDTIIGALTVLFFVVFYKIKKSSKEKGIHYVFLGLILSAMVLTRPISLIIILSLGIVMLGFFYVKKYTFRNIIVKGGIVILTLVFIVGIFNIPAIKEKGSLSFHNKVLNDESSVNWTQLVYLSAIKSDAGEIRYGTHVTLEDVNTYLSENGEDSLPKSFLETVLMNPIFKVKTFFKELFYQTKPFTRLLGAIFIGNLLLLMFYLFKRRIIFRKLLKNDIVLFGFLYIASICIIVSYCVDPRWFLNILLLLPLIFTEKIVQFKEEFKLGSTFDFMLINVQVFTLVVMSAPFIIKNIAVLF